MIIDPTVMTNPKDLVRYVSEIAFKAQIFEELGRERLFGLVEKLKKMELWATNGIFHIDVLKDLWTAAVLLNYNIKNPRLPNSIARLTEAHRKFCHAWKIEDLLTYGVESLEDFLRLELSEWVFRETAE